MFSTGKRQTDKSDQHHQCRPSSCEHAQKHRMPDKQATDCPCYRDKQDQKAQATSIIYEPFHNLTEEAYWIGYESYQQDLTSSPCLEGQGTPLLTKGVSCFNGNCMKGSHLVT